METVLDQAEHQEEFKFEKCFKNGFENAEKLIKNRTCTMAIVACKNLDIEYIRKHMHREEINTEKDKDRLLKLQEINTRMKMTTQDTSISVEDVADTMKHLVKSGFLQSSGELFWTKAVPMFFLNLDTALVIAPRVNEDY